MFNNKIKGYLSLISSVLIHLLIGNLFSFANLIPYYQSFLYYKHNNTEVAARGSQIHDYFGHIGKEPITENMLKYARDNYVADTNLDNDMYEMLWSTKNLKSLADWMTKYATGISLPIGITATSSKGK